ncbi:nuclear transport factor 2 family protein [Kribbella deserti]|uniref:Nuclear transport factor 2 family protein n=1 Tax=Kribbella deserti TaxID=1926257 RepID=A0ABV6QDR6_9ACTN
MTDTQTMPTSGFEPTEEDLASVQAWFERYDALAAAHDYEAMADQAVFPLNEVSDDGNGNGKAESISREAFIAQMEQVIGGGPADVEMESTRTPHFLSESLVFVVTEGTMSFGGQTMPMRYGDLLLKVNGQWKFQTMAQGGWG